jgi:manganese transport protein
MAPTELPPAFAGARVDIRSHPPGRARLWAFIGPAAMVSVGYMDPGNWATDLEGGARFGYRLLWVLLASNLVAVLLQTLAARLGVVARRDLARACRDYYSAPVARALWLLCEIAIIACDLAEVLGSAIAINLLFGLPLVWGALITGFDVLLIVALQSAGIRRLEAFVAVLVLTIGGCLAFELILARPQLGAAVGGLVPHLSASSLYVAIGILGATVMPHNLYLHSALVQTRQIGPTLADKREALRCNFFDTALALNIAFFVNAAILVLSAATFFTQGLAVTALSEAHKLLTPLLGTGAASAVFALALLAAGQSSTITGTLAGQIVMEGFLNLRMRPVLRRLITRGLAIVPAVVVLAWSGEAGATQLLVLSQVVLSLQLPFAIVPLIRFTSDSRIMGSRFTNPIWVRVLAWSAAAAITALNIGLITQSLTQWLQAEHTDSSLQSFGVLGAGAALIALLLWISFRPLTFRGSASSGAAICDPTAG